MTEEIAAPPGWAEEKLDQLFAALPSSPTITAARESYLTCLSGRKAPAAPSDMLGDEFAPCRPALRRALATSGLNEEQLHALDASLETLEAEIAAES